MRHASLSADGATRCRRGLTVWIAAACLCPAALYAQERPPRPRSGNPLWAVPIDSLPVTKDRPIFSPGRRATPPILDAPVASAAIAPPAPAATRQPPPLVLMGTVLGQQRRLGVFLDETTRRMVQIKAGTEHAGWTLRSLQPRQAILDRDNESVVLSLSESGDVKDRSRPNHKPPGQAATQNVSVDIDGQIIVRPADLLTTSTAKTSNPNTSANTLIPMPSPSASTGIDIDNQVVPRPNR